MKPNPDHIRIEDGEFINPLRRDLALHGWRVRPSVLGGLLVLTLLGSGCCGADKGWMFSASRWADCECDGPEEKGMGFLAVLAGICVDLPALPVTVAHDMFAGACGGPNGHAPWVMGILRAARRGAEEAGAGLPRTFDGGAGPAGVLWLAIDLAALPVTIIHDLVYVDEIARWSEAFDRRIAQARDARDEE